LAEQLRPWHHLSSEGLLDHPWCRLTEDSVVLPSGKHIKWWRFTEATDFVCVLCLNDKNQVLIAYQYNHPPRCTVDELPGGGQESDDASIEETARRELMEEIGLYAHTIQTIGSFLPNNRRSASRCHVCLASNLEQRNSSPEDTETIVHEWVNTSEINALIQEGRIKNGILLAAWSIFQAHQMTMEANEKG
jgi:8-oxo-dGTP pyrophosphatase MutT (NUDIX family)